MRLPSFFAAMMLAVGLTSFAMAAGDAADARRATTHNGPVTLNVSVDKSTAQVADPIRLEVEIEAPAGVHVKLPQLATPLGEFEVRRSEALRDIPAPEAKDKRQWFVRSTLETLKTGELSIPAIEVRYTDKANPTTMQTICSNPISIHIASVLENHADPAKMRDIKGTVDLPMPTERSHAWIAWTAGGISGATALALLALVVAKKRGRRSPAAWALAALTEMEQQPAGVVASAEARYRGVVDIVREFIELEFGVPAISRTSREVLNQADKQLQLPESPRKRLAELVSIGDQVKFARLGIDEQHVATAISKAKAFVQECEQHRMSLERKAG